MSLRYEPKVIAVWVLVAAIGVTGLILALISIS